MAPILVRIVEHSDKYTIVSDEDGESMENDGGDVGYSDHFAAITAAEREGWTVVNADEF